MGRTGCGIADTLFSSVLFFTLFLSHCFFRFLFLFFYLVLVRFTSVLLCFSLDFNVSLRCEIGEKDIFIRFEVKKISLPFRFEAKMNRAPYSTPKPFPLCSPLVKCGVKSPKFIWAPCAQCTRGLLVSQDRRHLFVTPCCSPKVVYTYKYSKQYSVK
jgi:hypothetical protein